jgi:hypothetical protein
MDDESKQLLEKTLEIAQENNTMLHKMRRAQFWSNVVSALYWIFIIGTAIGAYYYLQPYLDQVLKLYDSASATLNSLKSIGR